MPCTTSKRDERDERERADLLRPPADLGHGREHFVDRLLRLERLLVLSGGVEHVVAVEAVGQFVADEVAEQQPARRLGHVLVNQRQAERLAAAHPLDHGGRAGRRDRPAWASTSSTGVITSPWRVA